jgi:DNA (cytosine-5)-methyltransferase 1
VKYLSVCSGIEAATVAWHHMGWQPVAFSEIEKFPAQVLAHHYPDVPNYGDMTKFMEWPNESIDLLVGGTPCQSFSVAGLRRGMADPRGNLALTYLAIADRYKPRWIVWENVPGVLSSNGGRDFGSFLGALAQLGYGFAYRVLDARFFGVAQRRRRVFVVGYLGDWRRAAAVLFEQPSGSGDTPSRREKRQSVAPTVVSGPPFSRTGNARVEAQALVSHAFKVRQGCEGGGKGYLGSDELAFTISTHQDQHIAKPITFGAQMSTPQTDVDLVQTLQAKNPMAVVQPVATPINTQMATRGPDTSNTSREGLGLGEPGDPAFTLLAAHHHAVQVAMQVRRLTPTECERLQGFPDGYTNIKDNCPDGPRYKALGNSMAVPVMRWIGERIDEV